MAPPAVLLAVVAAALSYFVAGERLAVAAAVYVGLLSLVAWALFAWDKRQARRGGRRIAERELLTLMLLGAAPGAYVGMRQFRHKTKHTRFRVLAPVLALVWLVVLGGALYHDVTRPEAATPRAAGHGSG